MCRLGFFVFICFLQYVAAFSGLCGRNNSELSCTTEILGQRSTDYDTCRMKVFPPDSQECGAMTFGPLSPNTHIGGVTLKPYIVTMRHNTFYVNHTVLNITFSNIKWKTMKFRFQDKYRETKNHCRTITISNDITIDDESVLFYDCYWPKTDDRDGQSHTLDFEAVADDKTVNRGKYYFNIPSAEMLSLTTTEDRWKPFIYIEIFNSIMRLHIMPPPRQLKINAYRIRVVTLGGRRDVQSSRVPLNNNTEEVTYDYNFVGMNGSVSFVVTPLHDQCEMEGLGCTSVESPRIKISSEPQTLNICIASITALIVATLFAYYIVLRLMRRYCCHDRYREELPLMIPTPPKILVVYSPANRLHAECVMSFVTYLRSEYGFDIMYDGDISSTLKDPYNWAQKAFELATHVLYVVGPAKEANSFKNIYDDTIISPLQNVDVLLLSFVRANRSTKEVINVMFDHSNGEVPEETKHAKTFVLLKDWQKLISYLSKDLLPKVHIMRSEKGKRFYEDLNRAKKLLGAKNDEVSLQYEKVKNFEKKILV
ncbi:unnamed protein product [Spodoptera exigua]|nr:unnamed protein product [Spodoptera exigua]